MIKVLVVDDSNTMRRIIKKTLNQAGVEDIVEAEDGIDALKKLAENTDIDLIMLDVNMPRADGLTTLKELKSMPETAAIPVIMCTSESDKSVVIECIRSGAKDYIVKPFNKEIIAEKIQNLLKT